MRINQKMQVRYIVEDEEFFVLIEPDFERIAERIARIDKKISLKKVEAMIDRSEPRNLILGFSDYTSSSQVGLAVAQTPRLSSRS